MECPVFSRRRRGNREGREGEGGRRRGKGSGREKREETDFSTANTWQDFVTLTHSVCFHGRALSGTAELGRRLGMTASQHAGGRRSV